MAGREGAFTPTGTMGRGRLLSISRILLIVGGVLFLSGHSLFIGSFFQGTQGDVTTLPPGPEWFFSYEIKVLGAGRVSGQFADTVGGLVDMYVFDEAQFRVFAFIGLGHELYALRASSGSFSADLPEAGTYYLVFAHGDGSEYSAQPVRVSYWVAGIEPAFIGIGTAFITAGIAGVGIGLWQGQRRHRRATPAS